MLNIIIKYFDLGLYSKERKKAHLGDEDENLNPKIGIWTIIYYLFVVAGIFSKEFVDNYQNNGNSVIHLKQLVFSLIVGAVIFPEFYKRSRMLTEPNSMQIFIAFQFGFFFKEVTNIIQNNFQN